MKKILTILFLLVSIQSFSQDVSGSRVIAKQSFYLRNTWIDSLRRDTIGWQNDLGSLPAAGAVYKFVNGRMSSGGSNTDSLFGVQDNRATSNRYFNNKDFDFTLDSIYIFTLGRGAGNYIYTDFGDATKFIEMKVASAAGFHGSSAYQADASSGIWSGGSDGGSGNQYFSANSQSGGQTGQIGSYDNAAGRWIDALYEASVSTSLVSSSHIFQHLEQWNGSATQRFTNVRYYMDSTGLRLQTYRKAGVNNNALYKGILIDTSSNVWFENYGAGTLTTDANGKITATSDIRRKNVVNNSTIGLSAIMNIHPINYRWKEESGMDTKNIYTGFSAQELKSVIPNSTGITPYGDLTIQDRAILAALVVAIQEQQREIEYLKSRIK